MFCDIANFTAWSFVREPGQAFELLESIYGAFDRIATKRGVFKVESYVAVAGRGLVSLWLVSEVSLRPVSYCRCHHVRSRRGWCLDV